MSPEAQRIAIATACGWSNKAKSPYQDWRGPDGESCNTPSGMPNYTGDLNAMHEAEKVIKGHHQWGEYKRLLSIICYTGFEFPVDATAGQRSESFLRTLLLWKEAK